MLSPQQDYHIPWYRPVRYIRAFLSSRFWIPIAYLSYSFYLTHLLLLWILSQQIVDPSLYNADCEQNDGKKLAFEFLKLFGVGWFISHLFSLIMYLTAEKPFIDSRRAFVNKYEYQRFY